MNHLLSYFNHFTVMNIMFHIMTQMDIIWIKKSSQILQYQVKVFVKTY